MWRIGLLSSLIISPNPTALLQSEKFEVMIETTFDYIIVDTAPIG